jgi:SAM-dependent methyltransferase
MPDAWYENYEAHELVQALAGLPLNLTVIDINPKVVRVIAKDMPDRKVTTAVADLGVDRPASLQPLRGKFDLVVALTVIGRMPERLFGNAYANIVSLVKPGGLLLATGDFPKTECEPVPGLSGFYRRRV